MLPTFTDIDRAKLYLLTKLGVLTPKSSGTSGGPMLRVVIIRHGEKPASGDNLSCAGLNRALALPAVLNQLLPTPPTRTYVPLIGTNGKDTTSIRMLQTVMPYAVQHNLTINSDFAADNTAGLAKRLLHRRGTVLVVWEHVNIVKLAKKLGIKGKLEWADTDFDSIWSISFSGGGRQGKARHPVLTKRQQHIRPSAACPG